jgi:hypothetical protein
MDWQAFWLTIRLSMLVAAILLVVGLPVACWITYSRWRWKFLAEAVFALPIVLPPTVLGFLYPGRARAAQSVGTRLGGAHWSHSGVYLRRPADWLDPVQLSIRGAAVRGFVRGRGFPAVGGLADAGSFENPHFLSRDFAFVSLRRRDWSGSQLSPTPWASLVWC